jgi:hypothetical protein
MVFFFHPAQLGKMPAISSTMSSKSSTPTTVNPLQPRSQYRRDPYGPESIHFLDADQQVSSSREGEEPPQRLFWMMGSVASPFSQPQPDSSFSNPIVTGWDCTMELDRVSQSSHWTLMSRSSSHSWIEDGQQFSALMKLRPIQHRSDGGENDYYPPDASQRRVKGTSIKKEPEDAIYRIQLSGLLRYVPFPVALASCRTKFTEDPVPPGLQLCPSVFANQIGFDVSPELLHWIFRRVSGGIVNPASIVRRGWSNYLVHFFDWEQLHLARGSNDKILFDRNGVWLAQTEDQQRVLADYCQALQDSQYPAPVRLPKRCMVIRK